jgi:methionyl-tRNA synthetase
MTDPIPAEPTGPLQTGQPSQPQQPAAPAGKPTISYDDFAKLDLRIAKVLEVRDHPNADKLLVLTIDLGSEKRTLCAGLRQYVAPEALLNKEIVVVANLEPRKMRGIESQGMLLAASHGEGAERKVVVLTTDVPVPPGSSVS